MSTGGSLIEQQQCKDTQQEAFNSLHGVVGKKPDWAHDVDYAQNGVDCIQYKQNDIFIWFLDEIFFDVDLLLAALAATALYCFCWACA